MDHDDLPTRRISQHAWAAAIAISIALSVVAGALSYCAFELWSRDVQKSASSARRAKSCRH